MFNDFARPAEMWDLCLEMLHFAGYRDQGDDQTAARGLWDAAPASRGGGVRRGDADAAAPAARRRRRWAPSFSPRTRRFRWRTSRSDSSAGRGAAAPERGEQQSENGGEAVRSGQKMGAQLLDDALVAETVLRATRDSRGGARRDDRLLAAPHAMHRAHHDRRMQAHARHLQTPALRLRLLRLRARAAAVGGVDGGAGAGARARVRRTAAGSARARRADVCAGYAGEARRLLQVPASEQGAAEALAAEFEALGRRLASA